MTPTVTIRRYDPATKVMVDPSVDMLSFGSVPPSTISQTLVIDAVISGVPSAGNMELGVTMTDIPAADVSSSLYYDVFDSLEQVKDPKTPFPGISGICGTRNVVPVGFKSDLSSRYVALKFSAPPRPLNCGCFSFKWFFGFDSLSSVAVVGCQDSSSESSSSSTEAETTSSSRSSLSSFSSASSVSSAEYWSYSLSGGEATITAYHGSGGQVVIPGVLGGFHVTGIGTRVFDQNGSITGVSFPDSVRSIGDYAFDWCGNLTSVSLGSGLVSIGYASFWRCSSLPYLVVPATCTSIGTLAFDDCANFAGIYFLGDAPATGTHPFATTDCTVYRLASASGWPTVPNVWPVGDSYARPTAIWDGIHTY